MEFHRMKAGLTNYQGKVVMVYKTIIFLYFFFYFLEIVKKVWKGFVIASFVKSHCKWFQLSEKMSCQSLLLCSFPLLPLPTSRLLLSLLGKVPGKAEKFSFASRVVSMAALGTRCFWYSVMVMFQMAYVSSFYQPHVREACFRAGTKADHIGLQWQANKPNNILVSAFFSAFPFHDF